MKKQLFRLKKQLLSLTLASLMLSSTGCSKTDGQRQAIPAELSHIEDYSKYIISNEIAIKVYDSEYLYVLFDKETYEAKEYVYDTQFSLLGKNYGGELYDLSTEELIAYSSGISSESTYNESFYEELVKNSYIVPIKNVNDYIEGIEVKDYYSIDELKELEPEILKSVKKINEEISKTK